MDTNEKTPLINSNHLIFCYREYTVSFIAADGHPPCKFAK